MSLAQRRDASFILRIWWESNQKGWFVWRGEVINAGTRQTVFVRDLAGMIAFLESSTGPLGQNNPPEENNFDQE